ncbi:unnamed protein product [Penicillium salamii]|uniref:Zn(2)-C6 fungal-type domain-containing protein n=1 Tax=Penicillium salamii TaxID=1612424 RepID=A0A9W4J4K5_9EURO|nr:unnamed protein product [Penicillium salamii]CAG8000982.1 unnamed protein product [Penicillium salamii]CAG8093612.1 unnamed protein product [Penicillium salamii]CAG8109575.1 unnamed protein product [Penicillium salamii]CAG8114549.1 unnamed protein product [Penicillium salamii]
MHVRMHHEMKSDLGGLSSPPTLSAVEVPKRRRFTRNQVACDPCHMRRVRCDLVSPSPCSRCFHAGIECEFTRTLRKRGRTARSKLGNTTTKQVQWESTLWMQSQQTQSDTFAHSESSPSSMSPTTPDSAGGRWPPVTNEIDSLLAFYEDEQHTVSGTSHGWDLQDVDESQHPWAGDQSSKNLPIPSLQADVPALPLPGAWDPIFTNSDSNSNIFTEFPSTLESTLNDVAQQVQQSSLRYPVLGEVMGFLDPHVSPRLACHLMEQYFSADFLASPHTLYGHWSCSVLRKNSFLAKNYRPTKPALLMSMLWIAAANDRHFSFSASSTQQKKLCQLLGSWTMSLLPQSSEQASSEHQMLSQTGLGSPPTVSHDTAKDIGDLDDVITYIHIASIYSSEEIPSDAEWWKAAIKLARKLQINQENDLPMAQDDSDPNYDKYCSHESSEFTETMASIHHEEVESSYDYNYKLIVDANSAICKNERLEERRRTWWILYIMDRHLTLRHNFSSEIADIECAGLLLPIDETSWQNGDFSCDNFDPQRNSESCPKQRPKRRAFPDFRFHDCSLFGSFLPLMAIAGEILGLNDPRSQETDDRKKPEARILQDLGVYQNSLTASMASLIDSASCLEEIKTPDDLQQQTTMAYVSYFVQVLRMMIVGKRNWLFLVEDKECWTTPAFSSTISHALDAASFLRRILHLDPDVSFSPYFFGIQLFQGSLPMLLIVERLQKNCGKDVLNACEIMIRANEAALVTRNTDYQRRLRQLMRSAVSQSWGRPVSAHDIRSRRKAVFALYLWTQRGTDWPIELEVSSQS